MELQKVCFKNFRNLEWMEFSPCSHVNVIYGDNGQGKTNLLEGIWMFTGNPSFRGAKAGELVRFGQNAAELSISFWDGERTQTGMIRLGAKREQFLNRVPLKKTGDLAGHFYCVVFSPSDLELAKGSPKERRQFVDQAISQLTPQYLKYWDTYEKALGQRNALLKDIPKAPYLRDTLEIWDLQLAKAGTILSIYRKDYLNKLGMIGAQLYDGISSSREVFAANYRSNVFEEQISEVSSYEDRHIQYYFEKLQGALEQDIRCGFTSVGVHRDDLELTLNGIPVKTFGSQGQQKSAALTLKLSEAQLLHKITGQRPVVLLDDVMSELDSKRQDYIFNQVKDQQVFITCCDVLSTIRMEEGKIFHVSGGSLVEEQVISKEQQNPAQHKTALSEEE
ncbi:MAG: DNA replication/repair protein RecF [Massiliimalia sp.]|jgi:DNA replication and repair protein RecF